MIELTKMVSVGVLALILHFHLAALFQLMKHYCSIHDYVRRYSVVFNSKVAQVLYGLRTTKHSSTHLGIFMLIVKHKFYINGFLNNSTSQLLLVCNFDFLLSSVLFAITNISCIPKINKEIGLLNRL